MPAADMPHTITSGNIDSLTDADSQDFIHELTEKANKISYYNCFGRLPLAVMIVFFFYCLSEQNFSASFPWFFFIPVFAVFPFLLRRLKKTDKERLGISIHYEMEGAVKKIYDDFVGHFAAIKSSSRVWQYLHTEKTNGYKYSSGASNSVTRRSLTNIATNRSPLKWFDTNVEIPYLGLINTELYFFPERLIIKRQNRFAAVMYKNMNCSFYPTRFIEEEGVPRDSEVVGHTWKYLNKNGTPDKRFSNNRQLPICKYSEYHIRSESGINEVITTSQAGAFDDFIKLISAIGHLQLQFTDKSNINIH
jgi:hypothetical protein